MNLRDGAYDLDQHMLSRIIWGFKNIYGLKVKLRIVVGRSEMLCLIKNADVEFFRYPVSQNGDFKFMGYHITEIDRNSHLAILNESSANIDYGIRG